MLRDAALKSARHHHTKEGGARLENGDAVAGDHGGEAVGRRHGRALELYGGRARQQSGGNHVRLAGDPSGRRNDEELVRMTTPPQVEDGLAGGY